MNRPRLRDRLLHEEDLRLKPYLDTKQKWTIGVGRNLTDKGVSHDEAMYLLENDIDEAEGALDRAIPWWKTLDDTRQDVLMDMVFNLGIGGLLEFNNMLAALEKGDVTEAAREMLDSDWAKQVGERAVELAGLMQKGESGQLA